MFVKALILGNVNHTSDAQERSIRVDNGRAIECFFTCSLKQIGKNDDSQFSCEFAKSIRYRARDGFGKIFESFAGWNLRVKRLEAKFCETNHVGAVASCHPDQINA